MSQPYKSSFMYVIELLFGSRLKIRNLFSLLTPSYLFFEAFSSLAFWFFCCFCFSDYFIYSSSWWPCIVFLLFFNVVISLVTLPTIVTSTLMEIIHKHTLLRLECLYAILFNISNPLSNIWLLCYYSKDLCSKMESLPFI